jgi:hypothetical protein
MSNCLEFFYKKITQKSGEEIVNFIEKTTDGMLFTKNFSEMDLNLSLLFLFKVSLL